jgi:predicted nicotinamide N-methyase
LRRVFADQRRALHLFGRRGQRGFWLAWLADRSADWLVLLVLLVATWNFELGWTAVPWVLAAWFAPRFVLTAIVSEDVRWPPRNWPLMSLAKALMLTAFVGVGAARLLGGFAVEIGAAALLGTAAALASHSRFASLRGSVQLNELGPSVLAAAFLERVAIAVGGFSALALLFVVVPGIALIGGAIVYLAAAAALVASSRRTRVTPQSRIEATGHVTDPLRESTLGPPVVTYLAIAFTSGAVASALLLGALPFSSQQIDDSLKRVFSLAPLLLAAGGIGLAVGPLPVPRLLLRVSPSLLALCLTIAIATIAVLLVVTRSTALAVVGYLLIGLAACTLDSFRAIALRRLAAPDRFLCLNRISSLALCAGQLFGLLTVALISPAYPLEIAAVLAVIQAALVAFTVARGGRGSLAVGGLSSLPVKSVVHKLSWDTSPPAQPADFADAAPRSQRLARWISRHATVERLRVRLPETGRQYDIYRPTEESREQLFEQGRADPEKQMPYWAKVWPSGVALADVVVERKEEVASKHVLELGAGLGVTACAVLEHGGQLVTADYSALPLAHCRLNTLVNTGRVPHATCFNWRHNAEVSAALDDHQFKDRFPLIIAGDVLYEGRDADPLLNVIERMLVDDGSLWLAEPVRRTAQRFLDSAAALGWEISSKQVTAEWPDATNGPVNLHFLSRSRQVETVTSDLGGWRI